MKRNAIVAALVLLVAAIGWAEDAPVVFDSKLNLAISSLPELKLTMAEHLSIPVLQGEGLFSSNKLELSLSEELAPVSVNLLFDAVFTPIAFLQFTAGAQIGSGWPLALGSFGLNGIGLNTTPSGAAATTISEEALTKLLYKFKFGGTFQFDLAAVVPGDWNHLVIQTHHEAYYRALAGVADTVSWEFENDGGDNRNGWNYYGSYFLGYQMPIFLNTVGAYVETDQKLYGIPGSAWGEDLLRFKLGPLFNFKFSEEFSVALLVQFRTDVNYVDGTDDFAWYQDRVMNQNAKLVLNWYRAAVLVNLKL